MIDILIFMILLALSAFFSGTETAFTSVNEYSIAADEDDSSVTKILLRLIKQKASVISALLVGNNIVNTVLAVYAGVVANKLMPKELPESLGPIIASVVSVVFLLVFGEVLPKQLGVAFSKKWCRWSAYPIRVLVIILKPTIYAMNCLSNFVMKMLPLKKSDDAPTVNELMVMAESSEKAGNIDEVEKTLIFTSSHINDIPAIDVMIPKTKVVAVKSDITKEDLAEIFITHMYSRIPVYDESIDEIKGIFNIKEFIMMEQSNEPFDIKNHLIEPIFIPGNVTIGNLMEQMKQSRNHMAIVVNEYGITDGIVTLENILERIIGIIDDEYDEENESSPIVQQNEDNSFQEVEGTITLQDISEMLDIEFSDKIHHRVNTLNGFLTDIKGDFLKESDTYEYEGYEFKVLTVKERCADKIQIKRVQQC